LVIVRIISLGAAGSTVAVPYGFFVEVASAVMGATTNAKIAAAIKL
jgi:hypothetical protein